MKLCCSCSQLLPLTEFHRKKASPDGHQARCKRCHAFAKKQAPWKPAFEKKRNQTLRYKYGITSADYQTLLATQEGVCALCGKPHSDEQKLVVDHCHDTGRIRGLLCRSCNVAIGLLGDSPSGLQRALNYVTRI